RRPVDAGRAGRRAGPRPGLVGQPAQPRGPGARLHEQLPHGRPGPPDCPGGAPMIWLTWRQLRVNAAVLLGAVAAFALVLAVTGPHLADVYAESASTFLDW